MTGVWHRNAAASGTTSATAVVNAAGVDATAPVIVDVIPIASGDLLAVVVVAVVGYEMPVGSHHIAPAGYCTVMNAGPGMGMASVKMPDRDLVVESQGSRTPWERYR